MSGGETPLRLVNNWLVGEIAQTNPESDFANHKVVPSIATGNVVMVNPMENRHFYVNLGVGGSVLWAENDIVYYKIVNPNSAYLHKARIENNKFVNEEKLSSDPVVRFFRWAFRGSMGE